MAHATVIEGEKPCVTLYCRHHSHDFLKKKSKEVKTKTNIFIPFLQIMFQRQLILKVNWPKFRTQPTLLYINFRMTER